MKIRIQFLLYLAFFQIFFVVPCPLFWSYLLITLIRAHLAYHFFYFHEKWQNLLQIPFAPLMDNGPLWDKEVQQMSNEPRIRNKLRTHMFFFVFFWNKWKEPTHMYFVASQVGKSFLNVSWMISKFLSP
jgi:hypothetical protein